MTDEDIAELAKHRHALCEQLGDLLHHAQATKAPPPSLIREALERIRDLEAKLHTLISSPLRPDPKKEH